MKKSRDNHYVPQWYQDGFKEPNLDTFAYLDLQPDKVRLDDGREYTHRSLFKNTHTSRCFYQTDLYSTFFGSYINDEIERLLFGRFDTKGAQAVRAFCTEDKALWHRNFEALFEYIDIQKIRTPKGLDWLKSEHPRISQNDLMQEMQGIRSMHCSIWTEGVREIVSAENANTKFIISDHPVTIYNHGITPDDTLNAYPHDPSITLKSSQTLFPLNRNFCLILTNLEYAQDPEVNCHSKRTFARLFKHSMVRTDAFIRLRQLSDKQVQKINFITKARAKRYIAAGKVEWLYPEKNVTDSWAELKTVLKPPEKELLGFRGEMFAKYDDGHVHYQDSFGRTESEREFLKKELPSTPLKPGDYCGCGSDKLFKNCCLKTPKKLRPNWAQKSIRERNLMLFNGIMNVLEFDFQKDWVQIRKSLKDEQISEIYKIFDALWPLETNILSLLPKPDKSPRAIYTGILHPEMINEFALGSSLYFGELLIQHPFLHPRTVKPEFNPIENPQSYRHQFLTEMMSLMMIMPLVEEGIVNLFPDPCYFDQHLQKQMFSLARDRGTITNSKPEDDPRLMRMMKSFDKRAQLSMPNDALVARIRKASGEMDEKKEKITREYIQSIKEEDPLIDLKDDSLRKGNGGQMTLMHLSPSFEMAMYLAQATGSCIVTDSPHRWQEIQRALQNFEQGEKDVLSSLAGKIKSSSFILPMLHNDILTIKNRVNIEPYSRLFRDVQKYLSNIEAKGRKPNFESGLAGRFQRLHRLIQSEITKIEPHHNTGQISCAFPLSGIQHHTVNRLLLMSNSEYHSRSVPMAFLIQGSDT